VRISSYNFDSGFCCVYSCSEEKIRAGFDMSDRTIPLLEMIEAKTFRTFIRIYSVFKNERLSINIKLPLHKALKLNCGRKSESRTVTRVLHTLSTIAVNRPWESISVWDVEAPTFSRQSAHRWRRDCQPYATAALYPSGRFLVLISVTG
jgi:hypothetical protein